MSEEIGETLNDIAKRNGITTATAMRRAFALLVVVDTQKKKQEVFLSRHCQGKSDRTLEAGRLMGVGSGAGEDVDLVKVFAKPEGRLHQ
ncbi:hypothetical protein D3C71_1384620 [compost metagenome]